MHSVAFNNNNDNEFICNAHFKQSSNMPLLHYYYYLLLFIIKSYTEYNTNT